MPGLFLLPERAVLKIEGPDSIAFLQGLVSNDVSKIKTTNQTIWTALLTPQGKFLHEFFIIPYGGALLLDVGAERKDDLQKRLNIYKLRSDVQVADVSHQWQVGVIIDDLSLQESSISLDWGILYRDPRLNNMGWRCLVQQPLPETISVQGIPFSYEKDASAYHLHRIQQGVPDGNRDLPVERAILLENGFEELHGIDWNKGCYMGQELMARTHYRGLIRKRLIPVHLQGPALPQGTELIVNEQKWGVMQGSEGDWGLALLYVDKALPVIEAKTNFTIGETILTPHKPDWLIWPETE